MKYLEMVKAAKKNGTFAEKQMWDSVESVSDLLDDIKDSHPERYWQFLREQAGIMNDCHYDREWAEYDVSQMYSIGRDGKRCVGAYWSVEQIEEATKSKQFPSGTTKWDKFVAYNAAKHDWGKDFDDENILKIAYDFYFADDDFKGKNKVWNYMEMIHGV